MLQGRVDVGKSQGKRLDRSEKFVAEYLYGIWLYETTLGTPFFLHLSKAKGFFISKPKFAYRRSSICLPPSAGIRASKFP